MPGSRLSILMRSSATRPDGYGLSLSSGRKLLRDLGGDLVNRRGESGGVIFSIHVSR